MRNVFCIFAAAALLLSLAACSSASVEAVPDAEVAAQDEYIFVGKEPTDTEKREIAAVELNSHIQLTAGDTFSLSLPYTTDGVVYASDNESIATVSDDGTVTPVGDGQCMVHVFANGFNCHSVVAVEGMGTAAGVSDPYAAYTAAGLRSGVVERELEIYASTKCGFSILEMTAMAPVTQDESTDDVDSGRSADTESAADSSDGSGGAGNTGEESALEGHVVALDAARSGCETKYELLTIIDGLKEQGYTELDVVVSSEGTETTVEFFAQ